jgi:hypothetical protein
MGCYAVLLKLFFATFRNIMFHISLRRNYHLIQCQFREESKLFRVFLMFNVQFHLQFWMLLLIFSK